MKFALTLTVLTFLPRAARADADCPDINGHSRHNVGGGTSVQCVYDDQQKGLWDERNSGSGASSGSSLNSAAQRDQTSAGVKEQVRLEEKAKARDAAFTAGLSAVRGGKMRDWAAPCQKEYDEAKASGALGRDPEKIRLNRALAACFQPHVEEYRAMTGGPFVTVLDLISNSDAAFTPEAYRWFRANMNESDRLEKEAREQQARAVSMSAMDKIDDAVARACAESPLGRAPAPFRDCSESYCPQMVAIPAGSFSMGGQLSGIDDSARALPVHQVVISRPFAMAVFETGTDAYEACMKGGMFSHCAPYTMRRQTSAGAVHDITRADAEKFASWLSGKTGKKYRLPTEAEWEYAARAGSHTGYPCLKKGEDGLYGDVGDSLYVGRYSANAFGVHDMLGGLSEMTQDVWHEDFSGAPATQDAATAKRRAGEKVAPDADSYVARGPSYESRAERSGPGVRIKMSLKGPDAKDEHVGFRLVRDYP